MNAIIVKWCGVDNLLVLYFVTVGAILFLCAPYAFTVVASVLVGHWVIKNV